LSDTSDDTKPVSSQKMSPAGKDWDKYSTHLCSWGVWKQKYTMFFIL